MVHQCKSCDKIFLCNSDLQRHVLIHEGLKPFTCDVCQHAFTRQSNLNVHRKIHTGKKTFKCGVCGARFSIKSSLTRHSLIHAEKKQLSCKVCKLKFATKLGLSKHMQTHDDDSKVSDTESNCENPVKPDIDSETDKQSVDEAADSRVKTFQCEKCGHSYSNKSNLIRHVRMHAGVRSHECRQCGKAFFDNYELEIHSRTHTGDRPYPCQKCSQAFASTGARSRHMYTHSDVKPFNCGTCHRSFGQLVQLRRHKCGFIPRGNRTSGVGVATNAGGNNEQPHTCIRCKKCFATLSNLMQHIAVHNGEKRSDIGENTTTNKPVELYTDDIEKNHICSICKRAYAAASSLRRHMAVHNEETQLACKSAEKCISDVNNLSGQAKLLEEEMHACTVCNRSYSTIASLRRHMVVHDADTRLECDICEEFFSDINHLARHMQIHSWEKTPFV